MPSFRPRPNRGDVLLGALFRGPFLAVFDGSVLGGPSSPTLLAGRVLGRGFGVLGTSIQ